MADYEVLKQKIIASVEEFIAEGIELSDYLADHPEISGSEFESSKKIVELLRGHGFEAQYPLPGYPTAFRASADNKKRKYKVAILTEYDALPEIGHACGHCVSCAISVLAGLAASGIQDELDCTVEIVGTPVEETDGAKCKMVKDGIFDGYDMAMMIHLYDQNLLYCTLLALDCMMFTFHGKAAHGASAPWEGINALNAAQLFMHAVDCMRQHVTPDVRMHGVYRNGGAAANVVPEEAAVEIYTRALDRDYLNEVSGRVLKMAEGACLMTGATFEMKPTAMSYDNLKNNEFGLEMLGEVFDELGIEQNGDPDKIFGSSDEGNISFVCPTFHPTLQIADRGVAIHTRDFECSVRSEKAHEAIRQGAEVIALQIAKIFSDEDKVKKLKECF